MLASSLSSVLARVAVATSLVLVVTLIQPVQSVAAEEVQSIPEDALVPAAPATALEQTTFPVEGDYSEPLAHTESLIDLLRNPASTQVRSTEEADLDLSELVLTDDQLVSQDEFTNTYEVDGLKVADMSAVPINVLGEDGAWSPVSTSVTRVDDEWGIEDHPLQPRFAENADDPGMFSVTRDGSTVSFTLVGADSSAFSRPKVPRSREPMDEVVYADVFDGVDLQYEIGPGNVKENLILDEAPETDNPHWSWDVATDGLTMVAGELNDILLQDALGVTRFRIPQPIMWDSSETAGQEAASKALEVNFYEREPGIWRFTVSADPQWLGDSDRVYPVFIDPSTDASYQDTTVSALKSDGLVMTDDVRVGNTRESGGNAYWRSQVLFNYGGIRNYQLLNADIVLSYWDGTASTYSGTVTAPTALTFSNVGSTLSTYSIGTADVLSTSTNIPKAIVDWTNAGSFSRRFGFRGDESATYTYKGLDTILRVVYKAFPSVTVASPTAAAEVGAQPILKVTTVDPYPSGLSLRYHLYDSAGTELPSSVYSPTWVDESEFQVPVTLPVGTYSWKAEVRDGFDPEELVLDGLPANKYWNESTVRSSALATFKVIGASPRPLATTANPKDKAVITDLTPELSVDPVVGTGIQYQFRVATGADGETGGVVRSEWLTTPSWVVPPSVLENGGSYTWSVRVKQTATGDLIPDWSRSFTVNQRLGSSGPSPFDSAGPATVNLANGNVSLSFASPLVSTLGGPMGMSFNYNSQDSENAGLNASYYNFVQAPSVTTPPALPLATASPVLVRRDPQINFRWADGVSPGPAVDPKYFIARWSGYVRVPDSLLSTITFGMRHDNGATIKLDPVGAVGLTPVLSEWTNNSYPDTVRWASKLNLAAGQTAIFVDMYNRTGGAVAELVYKTTTDASPKPVPASWFTRSLETLPAGWGASIPIAGAAGVYSSAKVNEQSVVLTDVSGGKHTYTKGKTAQDGYKPPTGEYGVLSLDSTGRVVLTEDGGTVYAFAANGKIESVTSPADSRKPATPISSFGTNSAAIAKISDPLSLVAGSSPVAYTREVKFAYQGDSGVTCESATTAGYTAPPAGMLCRITYPPTTSGGATTKTELFYNNGFLSLIKDPGNEQTSFGYTDGLLTSVTDSLANDWILVDTAGRSAYAAQLATQFVYEPALTPTQLADNGGEQPPRKLLSVKLPAARTGEARLQKTYAYGATTTTVSLPAQGVVSTVSFDGQWRQLTATSAMGQTSTQSWVEPDKVAWAENAQGQRTSTIYDSNDRPTDSYGPAPAECFLSDGHLDPSYACPVIPAHTSTTYDGSLQGLNTVYYKNAQLKGQPTVFGLGLQDDYPTVDKNWAAAAPATGIGVDLWSARLTGLITFPTAGTYEFRLTSDGASRMWIDDMSAIQRWKETGLGSGTTVRISKAMSLRST